MLKRSNYRGWFKHPQGFVAFYALKSNRAQKQLPLVNNQSVSIKKDGSVFVGDVCYGVLKKKDYEQYVIASSHIIEQAMDDATLINYKVVRFMIRIVVQDEAFMKQAFLQRFQEKPIKWSLLKVIYYVVVLLLALIAFVYSLLLKVSFLAISFFILVVLAVLYLLIDYFQALSQQHQLPWEQKDE